MLQEPLFRIHACKGGGFCVETRLDSVLSNAGEFCEFPLTPNPSPARGEGKRREVLRKKGWATLC